jgi:hypothetical protein
MDGCLNVFAKFKILSDQVYCTTIFVIIIVHKKRYSTVINSEIYDGGITFFMYN